MISSWIPLKVVSVLPHRSAHVLTSPLVACALGGSVVLAVWDAQNALSVHLCTACYAAGTLLGAVRTDIRCQELPSTKIAARAPCDVFDPWVRWERDQVGI